MPSSLTLTSRVLPAWRTAASTPAGGEAAAVCTLLAGDSARNRKAGDGDGRTPRRRADSSSQLTCGIFVSHEGVGGRLGEWERKDATAVTVTACGGTVRRSGDGIRETLFNSFVAVSSTRNIAAFAQGRGGGGRARLDDGERGGRYTAAVAFAVTFD